MKQAPLDMANILERTFHIRTSVDSGTALGIEFDEKQYLVTAKHLIESGSNRVLPGGTIHLYTDKGLLLTEQVLHTAASPGNPEEGGVDVAVLRLRAQVTFSSESPTVGKPEDLFVTQTVAMPSAENFSDFGISFGIITRTGTIAKLVRAENRGPYSGDFLVGMEAYPGFSGSPIICCDEEGDVSVVGVAARWSGRPLQKFGSGLVHTGLIGCFHMQHALKLMQSMS